MADYKKSVKEKVRYVPMISQLPTDMKFHYYKEDGSLGIKANCTLVKSIDELKTYAEQFKEQVIAVDVETTGLCFRDDFIVGFSISKDAYSGIYVPIRHEIKRVNKRKTDRLDEQGNVMYTKAGKPRQITVEDATFFPCEANLPDKEALDILYNIMKNAKKSLLHNSEYDLNMLRKEGFDIKTFRTFDTMILPYLYDPEGRGILSLKMQEKLLGRTVPNFKDVLGKVENFRYIDPELGYEYACYDSMGTIAIYNRLYPMVRDLLKKHRNPLVLDGKPYNIMAKDNTLIRAFVDYYDHVELNVNRQVAIEYKEKIIKDLQEVTDKIYTYFDKGPFSLSTSSTEFKNTLTEKDIVTGHLTDKGAISFGKEGIKTFSRNWRNFEAILSKFDKIKFTMGRLDIRASIEGKKLSDIIETYGKPYFKMKKTANTLQLADKKGNHINQEDFYLILNNMYDKEKEKLEILKEIQRNSSLNKAMNSYVEKLTQVDKCIMKYKLLATSSSRLASGNGSKSDKNKNHYFIDLNAQNLTKPSSCFYEANISEDEDNILGWKFTRVTDKYAAENKDSKIIVEGSTVEANIRNCFVAPKGRYVMSRDYSSQEYLTLALLSKDTKMLNNFRKGLDPHTSTAYAIWGEENYTKDKRKKAKTCLGGNSFVATSCGLVRPYNLYKSHRIIDKNGNAQKFALVKERGKLIGIQYTSGIYEEYTPDHKLQVWTGKELAWKEVQHLTPNDNIVQMNEVPCAKAVSNKIDTKKSVGVKYTKSQRTVNINSKHFAYIAGVCLTRGQISQSTRYDNKVLNMKFQKGTFKRAGAKFISCLEKLGLPTKMCTRPSGEVFINCPAICAAIKDFLGQDVKGRIVPDYVFDNWSNSTIKEFLKGLLDAKESIIDGNIVVRSKRIDLLRLVALLAAAVGVRTRIDKNYQTVRINGDPCVTYNLSFYAGTAKELESTVLKGRKAVHARGRITWDLDESTTKLVKDSDAFKNMHMVFKDKVTCKQLTPNFLRALSKAGMELPIKPNMVRATIQSKTELEGDIYVIETENHEYVSSCIVSHNCNFLINYGGGEHRLSENLEIPLEEARSIIKGYEEAFFECIQWKKNEIAKMYKNAGVVFTEFGRPRQFGSWIKIADKMEDAKSGEGIAKAAERRVSSHQIQGFCGDICRYVLIQLYIKYFRKRNPDIDFMSAVHDEINFSVTKSKLIEYARECEDIMKFDVLDKTLPISTSLDVGYSYGNCFPFTWEDDTRTKLIPKRI